MDIYLTKTKIFRDWIYQLWVDGEIYDTMASTYCMTYTEMNDVESGYREALDVLL